VGKAIKTFIFYHQGNRGEGRGERRVEIRESGKSEECRKCGV